MSTELEEPVAQMHLADALVILSRPDHSPEGSECFSFVGSTASSGAEVVSLAPSSPRPAALEADHESHTELYDLRQVVEEVFVELGSELDGGSANSDPREGLKPYKAYRTPTSIQAEFIKTWTHSKHYYSDGHFTFEADGTLYRIHRHIGETAPAFARALTIEGCLCHLGGSTEMCPSMSTVRSAEIEALLDLLYTPFYAAKNLTPETYRLALPLCIKWGFKDLRAAILSQLESRLDLFERYALARELHILEWEKYCLSVLVIRPMGLTIDEGRRLGVDAVVFISTLREDARTRSQGLYTCASCDLKKRSSGQSVDVAFVRERVQEWMERRG